MGLLLVLQQMKRVRVLFPTSPANVWKAVDRSPNKYNLQIPPQEVPDCNDPVFWAFVQKAAVSFWGK